ncbi:hypothetical protein [Antrihabitans sp. YC2-6]|uniref:hypothetical protein n=1 Tax=Antrihabitans sp. YC2-6 TaxID=2799498 RepID=UPI0018F6CC7B|nr:hypothetical protein [Antrihabitans sp. YC2-6]MBJ8348808.1 hypothetical protein [Antrihabitans sp. YC2-6]
MSLKQETAVAILSAIKKSADSGLVTSEGLKHLAEAYAAVVDHVDSDTSGR